MLRSALQLARGCLTECLPEGVGFSQSGRCWLSSTSRMVASMRSKGKRGLAFARLSNARSSDCRRKPVTPRSLVADMQDSDQRQCAGVAVRGIIFCMAFTPSTHFIIIGLAIRISSFRGTPPRSLYWTISAGSLPSRFPAYLTMLEDVLPDEKLDFRARRFLRPLTPSPAASPVLVSLVWLSFEPRLGVPETVHSMFTSRFACALISLLVFMSLRKWLVLSTFVVNDFGRLSPMLRERFGIPACRDLRRAP
mmetsp:Transcript_45962/g.127665  ORF Transcript_45962/g.127665 Transcript_45962/m.127665 type:complete len:251 (-) Transcript_45962:203-955(-)|eukprot:5277503-Prymnesium_polylepis.2